MATPSSKPGEPGFRPPPPIDSGSSVAEDVSPSPAPPMYHHCCCFPHPYPCYPHPHPCYAEGRAAGYIIGCKSEHKLMPYVWMLILGLLLGVGGGVLLGLQISP